MMKIKLWAMKFCPFVQRSRMVLEKKNISYEYIEVDLHDKPDWFLKLTPYGKVPVLQWGSEVLYESVIINEFLEEVYPKPALMEKDALKRTKQRLLIDYISNTFVPSWYQLLGETDAPKRREKEEKFFSALQYLDKTLNDHTWLSGEDFSLTDISVIPWFERFCVLQHYRNISLGKDFSQLERWWQRAQKESCFLATKLQPEALIKGYQSYAQKNR